MATTADQTIQADPASKKSSRGRRIIIRTAVTGALIGLPLVAITGTASAATDHGNNTVQNNIFQGNIWQNTPTQQSDWTYHHDHDADQGTKWFHDTFPTFQGAPPHPRSCTSHLRPAWFRTSRTCSAPAADSALRAGASFTRLQPRKRRTCRKALRP